jgi:hypothetical protein
LLQIPADCRQVLLITAVAVKAKRIVEPLSCSQNATVGAASLLKQPNAAREIIIKVVAGFSNRQSCYKPFPCVHYKNISHDSD